MINLEKLRQNVGLVTLVQTSCVAVQSIVHLNKTIHGADVLHLTLNMLVGSNIENPWPPWPFAKVQ